MIDWIPGVALSVSDFSGTEITGMSWAEWQTERLECLGNCQCRYIKIAENYKEREKTSEKLKMLPHISIIYFTIYSLYIVLKNVYLFFFSRKARSIYLIWGFYIVDYLGLCDNHSQTYSHQIFLSCSVGQRWTKGDTI